MKDGRSFLIVEPQGLVQADLAQAILELCPGAQVLTASSLEQAASLLEDVVALTGAIMGIHATHLRESPLSDRIEALGAWIVCLNGRRTDYILAEGWHPLARPFSFEDVRTVVSPLLARSAVGATS